MFEKIRTKIAEIILPANVTCATICTELPKTKPVEPEIELPPSIEETTIQFLRSKGYNVTPSGSKVAQKVGTAIKEHVQDDLHLIRGIARTAKENFSEKISTPIRTTMEELKEKGR